MTRGTTLDTGAFDCPKCGTSFATPGALGAQVRNNKCCSMEERFRARLTLTEGGCLVYRGCRDKWGYAHIGVNGKRRQAHRYAYELANGPIPAGKLVLHSCDNPPCCNPEHLRLGTDADNHQDMRDRGRTDFIHRHKLTEEQVREIRANPPVIGHGGNVKEYARRYGVKCTGTIILAARGDTWKEIK